MQEPRQHNYISILLQLFAEGVISGFADVEVRHEDNCDIFNLGGYCNCEPEIVIRKDRKKRAKTTTPGTLSF